MFTTDQLPQITRILDRIDRLRKQREAVFQAANPLLVYDTAYVSFLQPWESRLERVLADAAHRLNNEERFINREIHSTSELCEYNKLVCTVSRGLKVSRPSLRSRTLSELRQMAEKLVAPVRKAAPALNEQQALF